MSGHGWLEVGAGVFARRHAELDQTLGLIVGASGCLVVDTGTDELHGAELASAVRAVTPLPWAVLVTHAHWDHFFGTAAFVPCRVLAHPACAEEIADNAEEHRGRGIRYFEAEGRAEQARRLAAARVIVPGETLDRPLELDLGERTVTLSHPGRGHTSGDLVAHVPDAGVLFAGDLVEQGAPPAIGGDAHPLEWPSTVDSLLTVEPEVVVPGHGDPVDRAFVRHQRAELAALAGLITAVREGRLTPAEALPRSPFPAEHTEAVLAGHAR